MKIDWQDPEAAKKVLLKLRAEEEKRRKAENDKRPCKARTRKGTPCKAKRVSGRKRCRWHGGLSTGPKTFLGKLKARMNLPNYPGELQQPRDVQDRKRWQQAPVWPSKQKEASKPPE